MENKIDRILAAQVKNYAGQQVFMQGWVERVRSHGKLVFFDLRDRSGIVQIVSNLKVSEESYNASFDLKPQDVIAIAGLVNKRPSGSENKNIISGEVEVEAREVKILAKAQSLPFDMTKKDLDLELPTMFDYRSLTLRHPKVAAIFKVQEAIVSSFREAAKKLDCAEIFVPTIAVSSTEGGSEVFGVSYYNHDAYLTQSPQLYKQMLVPVFERVYTIAHAYRAEPSVTTRHLSETTQLDCEFGFENFDSLLNLLEEVITEILKGVRKKCQREFAEFGFSEILLGNQIPRLTLREAQDIIWKRTGRDVRGEKDLAPQDELDICSWARSEEGSDLVIIHHFPTKKRAFYTMPDPKDPEYSLSYDVLFRGIEIASGSQRINDYQELIQAIKDRGLNPADFELYLMAFKYGMPAEGGFSYGLERLTMKICELSNVREASLFPRDMERVDVRLNKIVEKEKIK